MRNLITDVPGLRVGNAGDAGVMSGVTVVLPDRPATAAVDVRGGAPGTRETDLLDAGNLVDRIDALVLSGGSAFGLDAAAGVMAWLAGEGRGFRVETAAGRAIVPIVPAAILFDLLNGGDKAWGGEPPYRGWGFAAARDAGLDFPLGNIGAGLGAKAGHLKGGLGGASVVTSSGATIGALVAVNSHGSVVMPGGDAFWAWPFERDGEFGGVIPTGRPVETGVPPAATAGANTTLAVVATDATLDPGQARRLAIMAQAGLTRAIVPAHTPFDGDVVFALSTGLGPAPDPAALLALGDAAAACLARAIARAVYHAAPLGLYAGYRRP